MADCPELQALETYVMICDYQLKHTKGMSAKHVDWWKRHYTQAATAWELHKERCELCKNLKK